MEKKKADQQNDQLFNVEETVGRTEQFIHDNRNTIFGVLGGLAVIVLGIVLYYNFVSLPKERNAQNDIFMAQNYFHIDSLDIALNGNENTLGFLDIIDNYGSTKNGNVAKYSAGLIYMKKGEFETAIKYLSDFSSDDIVISAMALGAIGDCHVELGDNEKAISYYKDGAAINNSVVSPSLLMKAVWANELIGDKEAALEICKDIKKDYPRSPEAANMDKYIAKYSN